jgi:hypothetical protein
MYVPVSIKVPTTATPTRIIAKVQIRSTRILGRRDMTPGSETRGCSSSDVAPATEVGY